MTAQLNYTCKCVTVSPDTAYLDNGGEPRGEGVAAEGGARVHGAHYLYPLQTHPLQLVVMETSVGQHLQNILRVTCVYMLCSSGVVYWVWDSFFLFLINAYVFSHTVTT